ncbi:MAG: TldD/PmbA family protein [Candidatus Wallbacteria bacterium]
MFHFPKNLYSDVRIETVFETQIRYLQGELEEIKTREINGVMIRIFDGKKWYYSSITEIDQIQAELDKLAEFAVPDPDINSNQVVKKFEVNTGEYVNSFKNDVKNIPVGLKDNFLKRYFYLFKENKNIKLWRASYIDKNTEKKFFSSKGSNLKFTSQISGVNYHLKMSDGKSHFADKFSRCYNFFNDADLTKEIKDFIDECDNFLKSANPVKPGKYTVVLSPQAAGIFAHESFGHKSEADFMLGDEAMKNEWKIGKKVGADILTIVDEGGVFGSGYIPFDDEGTKTGKSFLIKNGTLAGRLHSAVTAAELDERLTGNARAVNFEFEPIVRMTSTYILPGNLTEDEVFAGVKEGVFIKSVIHGSGLSTFTLAPALAYMIRDGKISEPVNISVATGNVFETLGEIDGLSDKCEIISMSEGGCGKGEQWPLGVSFGGPYVRVKKLNIQ